VKQTADMPESIIERRIVSWNFMLNDFLVDRPGTTFLAFVQIDNLFVRDGECRNAARAAHHELASILERRTRGFQFLGLTVMPNVPAGCVGNPCLPDLLQGCDVLLTCVCDPTGSVRGEPAEPTFI